MKRALKTLKEKHYTICPENIRRMLVEGYTLENWSVTSKDTRDTVIYRPLEGKPAPILLAILNSIDKGNTRVSRYGEKRGARKKIEDTNRVLDGIEEMGMVPVFDLDPVTGEIVEKWEEATLDDYHNLEQVRSGYEALIESVEGATLLATHDNPLSITDTSTEVKEMPDYTIDFITRGEDTPRKYVIDSRVMEEEPSYDTTPEEEDPFGFLEERDAHNVTIGDVLTSMAGSKKTFQEWKKNAKKCAGLVEAADYYQELVDSGWPEKTAEVMAAMVEYYQLSGGERKRFARLAESESVRALDEGARKRAYLYKAFENFERNTSMTGRLGDYLSSVYDEVRSIGSAAKRGLGRTRDGLQRVYEDVKKDKAYALLGLAPAAILGATLAGEMSGSQAYIDLTWNLHNTVTKPVTEALLGHEEFVYRPLQGALAGAALATTTYKLKDKASAYGEKIKTGLSKIKSGLGKVFGSRGQGTGAYASLL